MQSQFETNYHKHEKSHFWFKGRREFILEYLGNYPKDIKILDIGCSSGILLQELIKKGFNPKNVFGVDISENAIENCKKNGLENTFVMNAENIVFTEKFNVIIASDCLEHLQNDQKALLNWYSLLMPQGTMIVFVPAFKYLWSDHDEVNHHYRRYLKNELVSKVKFAGLAIEKQSYWNFFLFIPITLVRTISKFIAQGSKNKQGDLKIIPFLNSILFWVLKLENCLLKVLNFPFGISTFVIAKKAANSFSTNNTH